MSFFRAILLLQLGLMCLGLGIALMLDANVGVNPWSVLHQGLSFHLHVSLGVASQLVGLAVLGLSMVAFKVRPGIGTVLNALLVGPWVDLFRALPWFPEQTRLLPSLAQCLVGIVLVGFATGLYIGARLGAGPRDGFVLGVAQVFHASVRRTRFLIEAGALLLGFILGGQVGWETLMFALLIGPLMQASLRLFRFHAKGGKVIREAH